MLCNRILIADVLTLAILPLISYGSGFVVRFDCVYLGVCFQSSGEDDGRLVEDIPNRRIGPILSSTQLSSHTDIRRTQYVINASLLHETVISTAAVSVHGQDRLAMEHSLRPVRFSLDIQLPVSVYANRLWIRVIKRPLGQRHDRLSTLSKKVLLTLSGIGKVESLDDIPSFGMIIR